MGGRWVEMAGDRVESQQVKLRRSQVIAAAGTISSYHWGTQSDFLLTLLSLTDFGVGRRVNLT
jgi:hypothetical protein